MKNLPVFINIFFAAVIILFSCGKKIEAGSPEEALLLLKEKGSTSRVMDLYTDGTVSSLKRYMKLTGMSKESATDVLGFIPPDAEYQIISKKSDDKTAVLRVRFTKHRTENLTGYSTDVKLVLEGRGWKIDREGDFKTLISTFEDNGAENYLKGIR